MIIPKIFLFFCRESRNNWWLEKWGQPQVIVMAELSDCQGKFKSLSLHICGIIIATGSFQLSVIFKPWIGKIWISCIYYIVVSVQLFFPVFGMHRYFMLDQFGGVIIVMKVIFFWWRSTCDEYRLKERIMWIWIGDWGASWILIFTVQVFVESTKWSFFSSFLRFLFSFFHLGVLALRSFFWVIHIPSPSTNRILTSILYEMICTALTYINFTWPFSSKSLEK